MKTDAKLEKSGETKVVHTGNVEPKRNNEFWAQSIAESYGKKIQATKFGLSLQLDTVYPLHSNMVAAAQAETNLHKSVAHPTLFLLTTTCVFHGL